MAEQERIVVTNFLAGYNAGINKGVHPTGGLWRVKNFHPRIVGLEKKPGYTLNEQGVFPPAGDAPSDISSSGTNPVSASEDDPVSSNYEISITSDVRGCYSRDLSNGTIEVLLIVGNSFYQLIYDGTSWTINLITSTLYSTDPTEDVLFTEWIDKVYFSHAGKQLKYWDGAAIQDAAANAPDAGVVVAYEGFLVTADLQDDTLNAETYLNGLRWPERFSDANADWDDTAATAATSGFKVPTQCPTRILAGVATRDELVMLHQSQIHTQRFVAGSEVFRTFVASTEVGLIGKRSYASTLDSVMFAGNDNFYLYSQGVLTQIDIERKVREEIFSIPRAQLITSLVYYDSAENDIWWFIKTEPRPKAYVFNLNVNNWTVNEYDEVFLNQFPTCFIDPFPVEFGAFFIGENASIYKFGRTELTDNGTPIEAEAEFIEDFGTHKEKTITKVEVVADGTGDIIVGLDGMNNTASDPTYQERTISLDPMNPREKHEINFAGINGRWIATRLKTTDSVRISEVAYTMDIGGR